MPRTPAQRARARTGRRLADQAGIQYRVFAVLVGQGSNSTRIIASMPTIDLTDLDLADAARGLRGLSKATLEDAAKQTNPTLRAMFERSAASQLALAELFERTRKSGDSQQKYISR